MARIKKTKYIILGFINEKPKSGYDIKKCVEMQMSHYWQESYGQIYPTLKKMEEEGLVKKNSVEQDGRLKNEYSITKEGKKEFIKYMNLPIEPEMHKYEILVKLRFASSIPLETTKKNIEEFRDRQIAKLKEFNNFEEVHFKNYDINGDIIFSQMTVMLGIESQKAQIKWADDVLKIIEDRIDNTNSI